MAVQSPSTQIGHLKASSELLEHSVAGGAWCPLSLPTTGCADQHATELLVPIRPRTCGTPRKGHLAKFLEHVELRLCAKRRHQSHVPEPRRVPQNDCSAPPTCRPRKAWLHSGTGDFTAAIDAIVAQHLPDKMMHHW